MKKSLVVCDFCKKEIPIEEYHEYSIIKRGFFLAKTEAVLDVCIPCLEKFISTAVKRREKK